jgi:beta-lactamase regulating signal transducer with metallopeptidase domain
MTRTSPLTESSLELFQALPFQQAVERLGWTLLHSFWQFALVALLLWLGLRMLVHRSAHARYCACSAAMLCLLLLTAATLIIVPVAEAETAVERFEPHADIAQNAGDNSLVVADGSERIGEIPVLESDPTTVVWSTSGAPPKSETADGGGRQAESENAEPPVAVRWTKRIETVVGPWLPTIVALWFLGVMLFSIRPLIGWREVRRLRQTATSTVPVHTIELLKCTASRLGITRAIDVAQSALVEVPAVIGALRPLILLPVGAITGLSTKQLEALLAHELAHIRRHDYLVNLLQTVVETLLFHHPAVWWISRQMRIEREHCCDDVAVGVTGDRVNYGQALLAVEELRGASVLAVGLGSGSLTSRIRRLLMPQPTEASYRSGGMAVLVLSAIVGLTAVLWLNAAADKQQVGDSHLNSEHVSSLVYLAEQGVAEPDVAEPDVAEQDARESGDDTNVASDWSAEGSAAVPVLDRRVSLTAERMPFKAALQELCRKADVPLQVDEAALTALKLDLDEPVTIEIRNEPLKDALQRVIAWRSRILDGVHFELRGGMVHVTTFRARVETTRAALPEWLQPLYYRGVSVSLDADGNVVQLKCWNPNITDEFLEKLKTLPKLRELTLSSSSGITPEGLAHLTELPALEKLELNRGFQQGDELGNAVLKCVRNLQSLRELTINDWGVTDAGAQVLEEMPQLTRLALYGDGRLTDAALGSIIKMRGLKSLDLTNYFGNTLEHGWMRFSREGLRQLAALQQLEELNLSGHQIAADGLPFPRLKWLMIGGKFVDDELAAAMAQCRELQSLALEDTSITDKGLKHIAGLRELRYLSIGGERGNVTDVGVGYLPQLPHLERLVLHGPSTSHTAIGHLTKIKTLTRLEMWARNQEGDVGLHRLKELPRLRSLQLAGFRDPSGFAYLKDLHQLQSLIFEGGSITQQEFNALERALPNTYLSAGNGHSPASGLLRSIRDPNTGNTHSNFQLLDNR